MKTNALNFSEYLIRVNIALDNSIPVIVKSGPGEGKTQTCKQLATTRKADHLVINAVNKNPSHVNGLPHMTKNGASFAFYDFMRMVFEAKRELIVIIDDVLLATQLMQGSFMNLIEERAIDGKPIPDCVRFMITTNEAGQNAGSGSLLSPLINRAIILDFPRDAANWVKWGVESGEVCKKVLLFIHAFPDCLFSDKYPKGIVAFPSPRSFTKASKFIDAGIQDATTLAGLIGAEVALKAAAFFDNIDKFGNLWAKINKDPSTAPLYSNVNDMHATVMLCSNKFEKANVDKIIQYFKRYDNDELISILFALGVSSFPDSKETKAYSDYVASNQIAA